MQESDSYFPNKRAPLLLGRYRIERQTAERAHFADPLKRFTSKPPTSRERFDHMWTASAMAIGLGILAISSVSAAGEHCRSIKSDKERIACFERADQGSDAKAAMATDRKADGSYIDPVDWLKTENDKVSARLKGICRGC